MANSYHDFYGDGDGPDWADIVLDQVVAVLSDAGWIELGQSEWEGGLEERLLRRDEHCLTVRYDPVTRQIELAEGRSELEMTLDLLADDGLLTSDQGEERIDPTGAAAERWNHELLNAADILLKGRILDLSLPALPARLTVLGLHPHANGALRGPQSAALAAQQLRHLARTVGLIGDV